MEEKINIEKRNLIKKTLLGGLSLGIISAMSPISFAKPYLFKDTNIDSFKISKDSVISYVNLDMNNNNIQNIGNTQFNTNYTSTGTESTGTTYWDNANKTISTVLENGVIGQHFQEDFFTVQNDTGSTLVNGKVATYLESIGNSGNIRAGYTIASKDENPILTLGIITADILNGEVGKVTSRGKVRGIPTDGSEYSEVWSNEEILYKSSTIAGGLTNVPPQAPIPAIPVAVVISAHATNGTLLVRPTFPSSLSMLTDVNGTPLTTTGQVLTYDATNQYWDASTNIFLNDVTGRIGINTSNPDSAIHVEGTTSTDIIKSDIGFDFNPVETPLSSGTPSLAGLGAGNVDNGVHYYFLTYTTALGETGIKSIGSAEVIDNSSDGQVSVPITVGSDYRITGRKLYRGKSGNANYIAYYLATISNNIDSVYIDNIPDSSLGSTIEYWRENTTGKALTINGFPGMLIGSGVEPSVALGKGAGTTFFNGTATGGASTFIGTASGAYITSGAKNNGFGYAAMRLTTSGSNNNAFGWGSMSSNTIGSANCAFGHDSLYYNSTGSFNTCFGYYAGFGKSGSNLIGNTFIGTQAGYKAEGNYNVVIGNLAGFENNGGNNVIIGAQAGYLNIGSTSVIIGYKAGYNETGSNMLYISNSDTATPLIKGSFTGGLDIYNQSTTSDALTINGFLNQTSNLQSWKNSLGNVLSVVNKDGKLALGHGTPLANIDVVGTARFGDSTTNYATFNSSGVLSLVGSARVKKEIKINANITTKGASAPTASLRSIGASGGVNKPVIQFSKVTQQDVYFEIHPNADMDNTVNGEFHLMWIPGASWTTGNYVWKLEYLVKAEDAVYGDADITIGTPTTISMDVTPSNANNLIETHFTSTINIPVNHLVIAHFYRDVAVDNADDVGEVNFFEFEYTSNKLGE